MKCELCGTEVKVVGNTTKHYEPIDSPEVMALVEAIKLTIARADDYGDSHLSKPVRQALSNFQKSRGE